MEITNIKLNRMILLKTNERSERGEIVALARSISKIGLLVPFTVKRILHTDRYEVISGVKRFYACRMAHIECVPAYIVSSKSDICRAAVKKWGKYDYFELGDMVEGILFNNGISTGELADCIGYGAEEVEKLLKISRLGEFEREIIRRNKIPLEIASEITRFEDIAKRAEILGKIANARQKTDTSDIVRQAGIKARKSHKSPKFHNIKIFDNTVTRALSILKEAGVETQMSQEEVNGGVEYRIKINN